MMRSTCLSTITGVTAAFCVGQATAGVLNEGRAAALGRVLTEDQVFYRWQTTESGENLDRVGVMTKALNKHYMGLEHGILAGPGIYMAHDPISSSGYLPKSGGNLIEVRVPKGTRVIDTTDGRTKAKMAWMLMLVDRLENPAPFESGVVLKYTDSYYVAKNLPGRLRFNLYPGPDVTPAQIVATHRGLPDPLARRQVMAQVRARRPDAVAEIARFPENIDVTVDGLPKDEASELVRRARAQVTTSQGALDLWAKIAEIPDLPAAVATDHRGRATLVADMRELWAAHEGGRPVIARGHVPLLQALAAHPGTRAADANAIRLELLDVLLKHPRAHQDPLELAKSIEPLLTRATLDDAARAKISAHLTRVTHELEEILKPSSMLVDVVKSARLGDAPLVNRLERLEQRAELVLAAKRNINGALEPTIAALRASTTAREFQITFNRLWSVIPNGIMREGLATYITEDPKRYAGLFQTADDVEHILAVTRWLKSDEARRATYEAARDANVITRTAYLRQCIAEIDCRKTMLPLLEADHGRIFAGVRDFKSIFEANAHYDDERKFRRRLLKLALKSVDSNEQLVAIARGLPPSRLERGARMLIVDAARARGLDTFHSTELLRLRDFTNASMLSPDAFTRAAITNALRRQWDLEAGQSTDGTHCLSALTRLVRP